MFDADNIYRELKRRIVFLDYEPGQSLREKDLIEEFGVSRTPVREAFIRLESDGLVRIFPNLGTIVTEVSFQQLKDVFEIRSYLVRLAGQLAAARASQEELAELRKKIQQMKDEQDASNLMQLDSEVHELINKATKNEMLVKFLGMLRDQSVRIRTFSHNDKMYYRSMASELDQLLAALEERDEEESARILEKHTKGFVEHIRSQLF